MQAEGQRANAARSERQPANQPQSYVAPCAVGPDLMGQVRALYEESAVPVREIARRAGVTERTLYKYAQRHAWKPRYAWRDDHPCKLGRSWAANVFAPAKGAGGRFVRHEDAGRPFARGLKALDPAARAQASAACAEAARRAEEARRTAEQQRLREQHSRAFARMTRALDALCRYREKTPPQQRDPRIESGLVAVVQAHLDATELTRLAVEQCDASMHAPARAPSVGAGHAPPR